MGEKLRAIVFSSKQVIKESECRNHVEVVCVCLPDRKKAFVLTGTKQNKNADHFETRN